jgi:hypothetical protein
MDQKNRALFSNKHAIATIWGRFRDILIFLGLLLIILCSASGESVNSESERDQRWAQRTSPDFQKKDAEEMLSWLNFGNPQSGVFSSRLELRPILESFSKNAPVETARAFQKYFYNKLRHPLEYGLSSEDVSPYTKGISGFGEWPKPIWDIGKNGKDVIAQADLLLKGQASLGGKVVDLGLPGKVNWYYPLAFGQSNDPATPTVYPNPSVVTGSVFTPLANAYALTHDERYLKAWGEYMDDWSLNANYLEDLHPCFTPSPVNAVAAQSGSELIRNLSGLLAALPEGKNPLPEGVFDRIMPKVFCRQPLISLTYIRSNTHNWTPIPQVMQLALVTDEFLSAPLFFRENKRRSIEDNAVTQNLRDGTENQQCPWYNDNFHGVLSAIKLLESRDRMPSWREVEWVKEVQEDARWQDEIRENLKARVNYQIHLRTPQNEWPIPIRGGDKRSANMASRTVSPEAYADTTNTAILAAMRGEPSRPPYHSDWFPYGGYAIIREGWDADDDYGALFASPQPGSYGGYRSRSNNNVFGLASAGQDLLIDDTIGHYMYPTSPIKVDGKEQFFHAKEGVFKVGGLAGHKTYLVSAWTEPAPWRWHASAHFNVTEGIYDGPYADVKSLSEVYNYTLGKGSGVSGIAHHRVVQYIRDEGLWIVTDRMLSDVPHEYSQVWMFPLAPSNAPSFEEKDFVVDAERQIISTESTGLIKSGTQQVPKANVTLYQFSSTPMKYSNLIVQKNPKNHYMPYGRNEITARWKADADTQVVTLIQTRPGGLEKLEGLESISTPSGALGFKAKLKSGQEVAYLSSGKGQTSLRMAGIDAEAESLLLVGTKGIVMGCKSFSLAGRALNPPAADFEFTLLDKGANFTPIFRPVAPVLIEPIQNVFVDKMEIQLSSTTPGVEIRYTLDGTEPTPQSTLYAGAVPITETAVVKARAYRPGLVTNPPDVSGTQATPISSAFFRSTRPMEPVTSPKALKEGLRFKYWEGDWKTLWVKADKVLPMVNDSVSTLFDLDKVPAENPPVGDQLAPRKKYYAVQYEGFLEIPSDGVYTFYAPREFVYPDIEAGYDLRLFVGDKKGRGPLATRSVGMHEWYPSTRLHSLGNWSIALKKGLHPFKLYFLDYRTDAAKQLNRRTLKPYVWTGSTPELLISGPGLQKQPIPSEWFKY